MTDHNQPNGTPPVSEPTNPVNPEAPVNEPTPAPNPILPPPIQTMNVEELTKQVQACGEAYGAFLNATRALPLQDIYKQMGFQLCDSGWLWIKEGFTQAIGELARMKAAPAPTVQ